MLKIFILILGVISLFTENTFANIYYKYGVGLNTISEKNIKKSDLSNLYLDSEAASVYGGCVYKLTDTIYIESNIYYYFLFYRKENTLIEGKAHNLLYQIKDNSFMITCKKSIYEYKKFTFLVGYGIGISSIKKNVIKSAEELFDPQKNALSNVNKFYNFSYQFNFSACIYINNNIDMEISCNYFNLGGNHTPSIVKTQYILKNVSIGVRIKL